MQSLRVKIAAGAAIVAGAALGAAFADPAGAAGTWTVKAGSAATGTTASFTGTAGTITLKDTTTGTTLTCKSGKAVGSATVGTGLGGTGLAKVNAGASSFSGCTGPLNLSFTATGSGTWSLDAASYANGVTTGRLTGVQASIKNSGGIACSFTASGSVAGSFDNAAQTLTASPTGADLTVANVSGCIGLVKNGDKASVAASFKVAADNAANGPVTITSP